MDQPEKEGAFEEFKEALRVRGEVFQKVLDMQRAQMNDLQYAKDGKAMAWSILNRFDRWLAEQPEWCHCFVLDSD